MPTIHGIGIQRAGDDIEAEVKQVLNDKFWNDTWNALSGISIAGFSLGKGQNELGVMYYLLNDKIGEKQEYISRGAEEKYDWFEPLEQGGKIKNKLGDVSIEQELIKWKLLNEDGTVNIFMSHFLKWHIKATLYWRKKQIWEGNYWLLHKYGTRVKEICNASGNTITIFAYDLVLTRFTENITAKLGLSQGGASLLNVSADVSLTDDKGQNLRQAERIVVSDSKNSKGAETHTESKTITKSPITSGGGNKPRIGIPSPQPLLFGNDHTKSEYTFLQFESRWLISQYHPLGLRIQFNKDLLNQYRNRKELKGFPAYDYFNAEYFGRILNAPGFFQASIISWNNVPYANWFREKIENGIYLYENDHKEFYRKKISSPLNFASKGATILGTFNVSSLTKRYNEVIRADEQVGVDRMVWMMKKGSFCRPKDGGTDILPQLVYDSNGARFLKMDVPAHYAVSSNCPMNNGGYCNNDHAASWRFDENGDWQSEKISMPKGVTYTYQILIFNQSGGFDLTAKEDKDCYVYLKQMPRGRIGLFTEGSFDITNQHGDPEGVPPAGDNSLEPEDRPVGTPPPFNPQTSMPAESIAEIDPVGGGATEPEPEPEPEKEPEQEEEY